jgi:hypothetical protein
MRRTLVSVSLALLLSGGIFATSTVARQSRQDPDVLAALLVEVRGLREAMERLGTAGPSVQLMMGRLQLNEQRTTTFMRRLDEVRDRRIGAEQVVQERQQSMSDFMAYAQRQGGLLTVGDQLDLKTRQDGLAKANATLQRLQTEETTLTQAIATEQDRWNEINQRLEDLERVLTRR